MKTSILKIFTIIPSFIFILSGCGHAAEEITLTIDAGKIDRSGSIIEIDLRSATLSGKKRLALQSIQDGTAYPLQSLPNNEKKFILHYTSSFPAGTQKRFKLISEQSQTELNSQVDDGKGLLLMVNGNPLLRYNYQPFSGKPFQGEGEPPAARLRSGNIHPVFSPSGEILTEIFPDALKHHLGLWGAWVKTSYQGDSYDFWNLKAPDEAEQIQFKQWSWKAPDGPVFSGFRAEHDWTLAIAGKKEKVMQEFLTVRAFAADRGSLFDYEIEQEWLMSDPLVLFQHRYGGMIAWRYPSDWEEGTVIAVTSDQVTQVLGKDEAADATHARWLKVHGTRKGKTSGFLILCHLENARHPNPLRLRHDKAEKGGGGYVNFTPIREQAWQLNRGEKQLYRYRILVYDGVISSEDADLLWRQYTNVPQIIIQS